MPGMSRAREFWFSAEGLWELLRYDILMVIGGFPRVRRALPQPALGRIPGDQDCRLICDAMTWAAALYWKPVLCLQSAIVTARLLRRRGFTAEVVIGCRPEPFFSHAWVEMDGCVVNDSPAYRLQLPALARL
jgi:hypothetical protein